MTPFFIAALLGAVGLVALAAYYRAVATARKTEAMTQRRLAEVSQTRVSSMQTRNASLQHLQQKQRAETIDETKPQHLAERNDLDNDWSDRLPGAATGASHSGAADTTRASDSAGD
jgi:type II secretory pathway pseudopilin PulG